MQKASIPGVHVVGDDPMSLTSVLHGELNLTGAEVAAAAAAAAAATVEAAVVQHPFHSSSSSIVV